jgi:hypothetical protein
VERLFWISPTGSAEISVSTRRAFRACSTRRAYLRQLRSVRTKARFRVAELLGRRVPRDRAGADDDPRRQEGFLLTIGG